MTELAKEYQLTNPEGDLKMRIDWAIISAYRAGWFAAEKDLMSKAEALMSVKTTVPPGA